jgi:Protein of unknown function (DUF732)
VAFCAGVRTRLGGTVERGKIVAMKVLLAIATVLASAITLAPAAQADPNDAQFLQNVRNGMGRAITDPQGTIDAAHSLCDELQHGKTYDQVVMEERQANQYWDSDEAAFFVSASAQAYCPEIVAG